uniref:Uncharacterized protein n=1 Tax=Gasterosteus aculeatus TaxID=69293 RepID=G3NSJ3_GASAC
MLKIRATAQLCWQCVTPETKTPPAGRPSGAVRKKTPDTLVSESGKYVTRARQFAMFCSLRRFYHPHPLSSESSVSGSNKSGMEKTEQWDILYL